MTQIVEKIIAPNVADLKGLIQKHSSALSAQLQAHHASIYPLHAEKSIRNFTPAETAKLVGIGEGYLRQVAAEMPLCPPAKMVAGAAMPSKTLLRSGSTLIKARGEAAAIFRTGAAAKNFRSSP
jgi:hypothetical protein